MKWQDKLYNRYEIIRTKVMAPRYIPNSKVQKSTPILIIFIL